MAVSAMDHKPWQHTSTKHAFLLLSCFSLAALLQQTSMAAAAIAQQTPLPGNHTVAEAYQALGISPNPDGSMTREIRIPMVNATSTVNPNSRPPPVALSKDVAAGFRGRGSAEEVWLRLFRPVAPPKKKKLPVVIYFHGGDFVLFSATTVIFQKFCNDIASQIPAVVVSVEYRLAPEHRLPAAFDDAMAAVVWVQHQALGTYGRDPWLRKYADFSRVFLLGSASGGNIAYHTALHALDLNLLPLQIKGLVMNQPFFGGVKRTKSELNLIEDSFVPLYVNDVLWTLALPLDATRDHPFCNPLKIGLGFQDFGSVLKRLPRTMVKGNTGDPLVDRGRKLARMLKKNGVEVVNVVVQGGFHGVELNNATAAQNLYDLIKGFVHSTR